MQLNILLLLVAFNKFLHQKKVKKVHYHSKIKRLGNMLPMTSYSVTIATDCSPNLIKMCLKVQLKATEDGMG